MGVRGLAQSWGMSVSSGVTCLIVGPEGSGKTLLVRELCKKNRTKTKSTTRESKTVFPEDLVSHAVQDSCQTIPTVGTNVERLQFSKGLVCTLKEYGGQMAPIWCDSYQDASMVIYTIDSSNQVQVSASTILLLELISSQALKEKPILIFFNKTEVPLGLCLTEYKSVMRLDDIVENATQKLVVVEGSCWADRGIDVILDWISTNVYHQHTGC